MIKGKKITDRAKRVRSKLAANLDKPRLSVHRSSKYLYAQIIDDKKHVTLVSVSGKRTDREKESKTQKAKNLGVTLGKAAMGKKIKDVRFDRGKYRYHGRVKSFAEGAREGGLIF